MSLRPSSYAIYVTCPLTNEVLPLLFRDAPRALVALDDVRAEMAGPYFQVWLISPRGHLMDYRGA